MNIFQPGFFGSQPVHVALVVGGLASFVSGFAGVLTIIRGQSFAGHSLADVSTTGGSASYLAGVNPLAGFLVAALAGAGAMEAFGSRRARTRDVGTGIVLGCATGISALFLYWEATVQGVSDATVTVLVGSVFTISTAIVPLVVGLCALAMLVVVGTYRPLLLSSVNVDVALARGIPVGLFSVLYLMSMALAVAVASLTVGAILSTALLIGPGAIALQLTKRVGVAMLLAALIGLATTWAGVLLSYDSFAWPPARHGWPVSFFIVALVFVGYLLARFAPRLGTPK